MVTIDYLCGTMFPTVGTKSNSRHTDRLRRCCLATLAKSKDVLGFKEVDLRPFFVDADALIAFCEGTWKNLGTRAGNAHFLLGVAKRIGAPEFDLARFRAAASEWARGVRVSTKTEKLDSAAMAETMRVTLELLRSYDVRSAMDILETALGAIDPIDSLL